MNHILYRLRVSILIIFGLMCGSCSNGNNGLPDTDKTPPTIISTSFEALLTNKTVPVSTEISVIFSEAMKVQSVKDGFIVTPNNGDGVIEYDNSARKAIYRTKEANLKGSTQYTITLKTSIRDNANNPLKERSWTFETEDNVPPTVISTIPDSVSNPISVNDTIRIEFSEPIDTNTLKQEFNNTGSRNFEIKAGGSIITGTGTLINQDNFLGALKLTGSILDYKPEKLLPDTIYTVTINTGVTDTNGNTLSGQHSYSFKTSKINDGLQPKFEIISPINNSTGNQPNSTIKVKFTNSDNSKESMNWGSINLNNFIVKTESGIQVFGKITYDPISNILTFTPGSENTPNIPKSLRLLETYTITLLDSISDVAGNQLITTNDIASKFHTSDGSFINNPTPTPLGIGLGKWDTIHFSTKKDGSVHAFWESTEANSTNRIIMTKRYQNNTWDSNSTDITTPVTGLPRLLSHINSVVTDDDDNHMIIWRDKVNNSGTTQEYTSYVASTWLKSTDKWNTPEIIHKGSATQTLDSTYDSFKRKASVYRSTTGTVAVAWTEQDTTINPKVVIAMRLLQSKNGRFGTLWDAKSRVTTMEIPTYEGILFEHRPVMSSDSSGNIYVLYKELFLPEPGYTKHRKLILAKFPFPSKDRVVLDTYRILQDDTQGSTIVSSSSKNNIVMGWVNENYRLFLTYDTQINLNPDLPFIMSSQLPGFTGKQLDVTTFPSGNALAITLGNTVINYAEYDTTIKGWKVPQILETVTTKLFNSFQGPRDIVTIAWAANSKIYIKRYKPGVNFGWQPTQNVIARDVKSINITSGIDGTTTVAWQSFKLNPNDPSIPPENSNLFAIRLE